VEVRAATERIFSMNDRYLRLTQNPRLLSWILEASFADAVLALWIQSRDAREEEVKSRLRLSAKLVAVAQPRAALTPRKRLSGAARAVSTLDMIFGAIEQIVPASIADEELGDARERILKELERDGDIAKACLDTMGVAAWTVLNAVRDFISRN
jgi:hypothetical protein